MVFAPTFDLDGVDTEARLPHVVVVDPCFDAYRGLAASERQGRIQLHLRSSGREALRLADRLTVDAWLIAADLDDMSGLDFAELLRDRLTGAKLGMVVAEPAASRPGQLAGDAALAAGADAVFAHPISLRDLETLLGLPAEERSKLLESRSQAGGFVALKVGIGAAAAAIAVLIMG